MKHLHEIAEIRAGHPFRGRIKEEIGGNVAVLQMKDVSSLFFADSSEAVRVSLPEVKKRYLLAPRDIVFRSRGLTNTAAIIPGFDGDMVLAAPMFRVRVTSGAILPEYVCWYINQPIAQSHFDRYARGTAGRMIGKDVLERLPVEIPSPEVQRTIVEIAFLAEREQVLMSKLAERKKTLLSRILMQVASEDRNGSEIKRLPEVLETPRMGVEQELRRQCNPPGGER